MASFSCVCRPIEATFASFFATQLDSTLDAVKKEEEKKK